MNTRMLVKLLAQAALIVSAAAAAAQTWPQRGVQVVVGFSPGGAADVLARALGESMAKTLGQPVVIQNREGAAGTIATGAVVTAAPDGYTLGFGPVGPIVLQPHLKPVPYKPDDVVGVCQVFVNDYVLATAPNGKYKTMRDLVADAAKDPDGIAYGIGGMGSFPHLAVLQLSQKAKVNMRAIAYRGDPPVILAIKSGEIQVGTVSLGQAVAQGLGILGVFSPSRDSMAPNVPTMTEQGYPVVAQLFGGLYASKSTPPAVLQTLESACRQATRSEKFLAAAKATQQDVVFKTGAEFTKSMAHETEVQRQTIKSANLKLD